MLLVLVTQCDRGFFIYSNTVQCFSNFPRCRCSMLRYNLARKFVIEENSKIPMSIEAENKSNSMQDFFSGYFSFFQTTKSIAFFWSRSSPKRNSKEMSIFTQKYRSQIVSAMDSSRLRRSSISTKDSRICMVRSAVWSNSSESPSDPTKSLEGKAKLRDH